MECLVLMGGPRNPETMFRQAASIALATWALFALMLFFQSPATRALDDVVRALVASLVGLACILLPRSSRAGTRGGWILIGCGVLSWGLGQFVWSYQELLRGVRVPFPSVADLGFLGFVTLGMIGTLLLPPGPFVLLRARNLLDALIIVGAAIYVAWAFAFEPVLTATQGPVLNRFLATVYVLGDLIMAASVVYAANYIEVERRPTWLLVGGLAALAVADGGFAALTAKGAYTTGHPIDLAWTGGFLLIGLGAYAARLPPRGATGDRRREYAITSAVPIVLALAAALISLATQGVPSKTQTTIGLSLVGLVVVRQVVALQDNLMLHRRLEAALHSLQAASGQRTRLLNAISHDIANPLSPIKIQLHLLEQNEPTFDASSRDSLATVRRNVAQVEQLVLDLKDVARMESGDFRLRRAPLELDRIVRDTYATFRPVAEAKNVHLEIAAEPMVICNADGVRIQQVLTNLVNNALKFTDTGGQVVLRCRREATQARAEVIDSGRGLEPAEIASLFRPFSQVHDLDSIPERGTGLGLYISKGIIDQHGGTIGVESEGHGRGSRFFFTLPLQSAPAGSPSLPKPTA